MRTTQFTWHDLNGDKQYQPGEVDLNPNGVDFLSIAGTNNGVPNPNEKEPKLDEFSLAVERQLGQTFAVRVTGVYSNTFNIYKIANNLRPASVYNIPITNPDPGPDAKLGTADDPGTFITYFDYPLQYKGLAFEQGTLINDPNAHKKFKSFELAIAQRLAHNFQFLLAYSGTKKDWSFPSGGSPSTIALDNPNADYLAAKRHNLCASHLHCRQAIDDAQDAYESGSFLRCQEEDEAALRTLGLHVSSVRRTPWSMGTGTVNGGGRFG